MNTAPVDNHEPSAAQPSDAAAQKCFVCGDTIADRCFCKIHRKEVVPVMLCRPSCTIQYIDSTQTPAERLERERRDCEKDLRLFVGEEKPWS